MFLMSAFKDTLAPPIKHKTRFKIKDAKCHLRPRNKEKHREISKQIVSGKENMSWSEGLCQRFRSQTGFIC